MCTVDSFPLKLPQVDPHFQFILIRSDTCVVHFFPLLTVVFSPISFQQIYPVLAVLVSLRPRLRDVKPSGSAGFSPFYLREEISRSSLAWRRDATERTFISCQAQQISQDEKSSRGNGTEFLLLAIYQWRYRNGRPGRIKVSTFGIDIERPLLSIPSLPLPSLPLNPRATELMFVQDAISRVTEIASRAIVVSFLLNLDFFVRRPLIPRCRSGKSCATRRKSIRRWAKRRERAKLRRIVS